MRRNLSEIENQRLKLKPSICRTALYMPAVNKRALAKGPSLAADAIIIDLEDSVAPDAKSEARENATAALSNNDFGHRTRVLRVNDVDSRWFNDDMAILKKIRPDAVLVPKVETAQAIGKVQSLLDALDSTGEVKIWIMLETMKAVTHAGDIAASSGSCSRLQTICVGNNDLARDAGMRVTSDRSLLMPWLMTLLAAAKAYRLNILDGVYNDFKDLNGFADECEQGAAMGMSGKTLIHPGQIEIANQAYSPTERDIAEATLIVSAFAKAENAEAGVVQIEGRMVERLHLEMANQTLAVAKRLEERS